MATLKLEIVTPEAKTFSDDVDMVTLPAVEGEMGVFPQHVPLVKSKSDFNGANEIFTYDSNNYLKSVKDRNGYTTTYTNESVIGNPTRITQLRYPIRQRLAQRDDSERHYDRRAGGGPECPEVLVGGDADAC